MCYVRPFVTAANTTQKILDHKTGKTHLSLLGCLSGKAEITRISWLGAMHPSHTLEFQCEGGGGHARHPNALALLDGLW